MMSCPCCGILDEFVRFEAQVVAGIPWLGFGVISVPLCRSWWLCVNLIVVIVWIVILVNN